MCGWRLSVRSYLRYCASWHRSVDPINLRCRLLSRGHGGRGSMWGREFRYMVFHHWPRRQGPCRRRGWKQKMKAEDENRERNQFFLFLLPIVYFLALFYVIFHIEYSRENRASIRGPVPELWAVKVLARPDNPIQRRERYAISTHRPSKQNSDCWWIVDSWMRFTSQTSLTTIPRWNYRFSSDHRS